MDESNSFLTQLLDSLDKKAEWFDTVRLPQMLEYYQQLLGNTKNLYEVFIKKSIMIQDPYRTNKNITQLVVPETSAFTDKEASSVFGTRFTDYYDMLNFICNSFTCSVDKFTLLELKSYLDFNKCFQWSVVLKGIIQDSNTKSLANAVKESQNNTPDVIIKMIKDSVEQNIKAVAGINTILSELSNFQKQLYKSEIRKDLLECPQFNKEKALSSTEAEMQEIKTHFVKILGNKPFYSQYIKEIILEDQSANKVALQKQILQSLEIKESAGGNNSDNRELLMNTVLTFGSLAATLTQLKTKLILNLDLIFSERKSFFSSFLSIFLKLFGIKNKNRVCMLQIKDATGNVKTEKLNTDSFIRQIEDKEKLYNSISTKGSEYEKLEKADDNKVLDFVNIQISECQSMYTYFNALDTYFKSTVDVVNVPKIKGTQIERTAMRNTIMNVKNKRDDYKDIIESERKH